MLETVLAVPLEETRVRPIALVRRQLSMTGLVDECLHTADIIDLTRNDDLISIRNADETTVKHPMCSARESHAILQNVRASMLNRSDMGSINFRPSATIDEFKTAYCTPLVIGTEDDLPKDAVTHDPRGQLLNPDLGLLEHVRRLALLKLDSWFYRFDTRESPFLVIKAALYDAVEILWRDWTHR